jgi:hypothetical protein
LGGTGMKKQFSFMLNFFVIGIILAGGFISYSYSSEKQSLLDETSNNLIEIAKGKSERINNHLSKMEEDIQTLQGSENVKRLLEQELVFEESVIKRDVDERSRIITKEVENYLRAHPEMTLKDLQGNNEFNDIAIQPVGKEGSKEFQDIAIQPVGKEGYSFVFDSQSLINYFHKEPRRVGYDYNTMEKTFPALWKMFKETSKEGSSEGFYYRDEPDGSISHKYGRFVQIPVKTADGISMSIGATAYVKDYKIIKGDSNYLEDFNKEKDYHNLILISSEGYVIYQAEEKIGLGTNLEWPVNLNKGLSETYFNAKESNQSFNGPFIRSYGEIYPKIFLMISVYDKSKLLGFVGLINEMDEIFEISKEIVGLGETEESYLVDNKNLLISPLTLEHLDMLVQLINTKNVEDCFSMESMEHTKHIETGSFFDYRGELVLGTHMPIFKVNWCLLTEVDKSELIDIPMKARLKRKIFILLPSILILTLIGFCIGNYFEKKNKKWKIKKYPCGTHRKIQPWYCKLMGGKCTTYPNGRCGMVIKTRNFFINLKLRYFFLFAIVFAIGYFFLINLFFDRIIYSLILSGLLSFILGFLMFSSGFKLKHLKSRKYLFLGAGAIVIYHLVHIPMEQYFNLVKPFNVFYWTPAIILYALGFLSLLNFLEKSVR